MENQNQNAAAETAQTDAVKANWEVFRSFNQEIDVQEPETTSTETKEEKPEANAAATTEQNQEEKPESKEEKPETKTEEKPEVKAETKTEAKETKTEAKEEEGFTLKDVSGAPEVYENDSWQATAQDLGFKIEKDSFEDFQKTFKENFVPRSELEKVSKISKDQVLAEFKPELAAAIKLTEMGLPKELVLNPTGDIDNYLALEDAELVRKALEVAYNGDEEVVDLEMEKLAANGKVSIAAKAERINLENQKKQILQHRDQLINKYTEEKQQLEAKQKEERAAQFNKAFDEVQTFMGVKVLDDARKGIAQKFQEGKYDDVLNNPKELVNLIYFREFGEKRLNALLSKAKAEGREEIVAKLDDRPSTKAAGSGGAVTGNSSNKSENPMSAIIEDFK